MSARAERRWSSKDSGRVKVTIMGICLRCLAIAPKVMIDTICSVANELNWCRIVNQVVALNDE